MRLNDVEIAIGMKQTMTVFDTKTCDEHIDGFSDGNAVGSKPSIIAGTGESNLAAYHW